MKGTCLCGTVKFVINTTVTGLYQCHCKLCQKQSGSTSNTATIVKEKDFEWLSGMNSITHWKKDTGFTSDFCSTCGCPVPNKLRDLKYYWIPMGLFDSQDIPVIAHLCCNSKAFWDALPAKGKKYEEMPDDLEDFISRLQKKP
ncbi:GFA family protein [Pleionea sediminis]|uniref:GFA family protein n=1 Tax=Pleionea sediminis TaxID=2569479 RepID=UPI001184E9D9|nr:GFA family protein [Pleionea sediminis]